MRLEKESTGLNRLGASASRIADFWRAWGA
jgi:hypothetical protein